MTAGLGAAVPRRRDEHPVRHAVARDTQALCPDRWSSGSRPFDRSTVPATVEASDR